MADRTPQQLGRDWEQEFARRIGATPVKNSGAGFLKLDVRGAHVLWSLKWSGNNKSIRIEDAWMEEALAAIHGPGGIGGEVAPGIATKTSGFELVTLRLADALMLMSDDTKGVVSSQQQNEMDLSKRVPEFLRNIRDGS